MSRYLKINREQLKSKIFSKLNLSLNEDQEPVIDRNYLETSTSELQLDKMMKQTQKRKLNIRKLINNASPTAEFSDEMAQLKWRIDALKSFGRNQKQKIILNTRGTSLTGKQQTSKKQMTFDQLYENQKKKFSALKQRRKTKLGDPKYIDMIGNMQARKEKRKLFSKTKLEDQLTTLNNKIDQKSQEY